MVNAPKSVDTACGPHAASEQAAWLFERAILSLSIAEEPAVFRAFAQIGIETHAVAQVFGMDADEVACWGTGQKSIPRDDHVMLLAYMSALLAWLFGAQSNLNQSDRRVTFARQRIEEARRLIDLELQTDPTLAREVRTIADEIDAVSRQGTLRLFADWAGRSDRKPPHGIGRPARTSLDASGRTPPINQFGEVEHTRQQAQQACEASRELRIINRVRRQTGRSLIAQRKILVFSLSERFQGSLFAAPGADRSWPVSPRNGDRALGNPPE